MKTFLLADLVLLAVVIPGYFYFSSQVSSPAEFQVTNLSLDSEWVQVGDSVQISADVKNIGDLSGNYSVVLIIDDVAVESTDVQLSGGEATKVSFTRTEQTEGMYTVTIDDLTKSLKVTTEKPTKEASLKIDNIVTSRQVAGIGELVTVTVTCTNTGDVSGDFTIELFVNDVKQETKIISLDGEETTTTYFDFSKSTEGEYVVKVEDKTATYSVSANAPEAQPAAFEITDLTVNPSLVTDNEVVQISAKVTNVGEITGDYTVNLKIDGTTQDSVTVTLPGQASETASFEVSKPISGTYNVDVNGLSSSFTVEGLTPASENTYIHGLTVSPYEVWGGETVTIKAKADNLANEQSTLHVRIKIEGQSETIQTYTLEPSETDLLIELTVTAPDEATEGKTTGYKVELINVANQTNKLTGYFQVAPDGYHTLSINRSGGGSTPMIFTLDGVTYESPYSALKPVGDYEISTDEIVELEHGVVEFSHWNDGVTDETRTLTLDRHLSVLANYIVISGYASCPSLYFWNGEDYTYTTEVSNAGWLGYIDYITDEGDIVFGGGNPWDHVKLDQANLATKNDANIGEYFDLVLFQQWNEIFYFDSAYMVVVDHPNDTDVYSTMVNYVNKGAYNKVYTVDPDNLLTPVSAVTQDGEDVLDIISELDSVFTPSTNGVDSPSWDNIVYNQLTLDLGDLSEAEEIKLVINGMVDWGPAQPYYDWITQFETAAAQGLIENRTQINPPAYMEVMDAEGNWVQVSQDRQMPIPGDYVPRTFAVDLNGLFAEDVTEYKIRITNFWNVTFDYIGIDVSKQANITTTEIPPIATLEPLEYALSTTNASGNFTKYGDVTELLIETDDKYVIGLQADTIYLKFPTADLPELEEGMERSYFLYVASWFKDHYGNWGYEFDFTVEPLPFRDMSGFPYPLTEQHPMKEGDGKEYDEYFDEWNTRVVNVP
ncbi:MAG: CARDB domain-containing protein [archaeon]